MTSLQAFLVGSLALLSVRGVESAMSQAQMKQAMKTVKNLCIPRSGTTKDAVNKINEGDFEDTDKKVKCYLNCILGMMQAVKNNKINLSLVRNQLTKMVEPELGKRMLAAFESCQDLTADEECELAFIFTKCLYEADKDVFILP